MFKALVHAAYEGDQIAIIRLGEGGSNGDFRKKDSALAKYLYEIAKGNRPEVIRQYRKESAEPKITEEYLTSKEAEEEHLAEVLGAIQDWIFELQESP